MTTDTKAGPPPIDLARLSDKQLKARIELNRDARYGLESATREQLNIIFILCRRWQLDPVTDVTLYQGHPWVTLDGWCRVIRRHPEWTTLRQFPVKKDDKLDWGYNEDDIVVATVIGTRSHGEITGYGKVTKAEVGEALSRASGKGNRPAPIAMHPVEMATKRSLARTARIALGLDIPDESVVEQEISEEIALRNDPVKLKADAATYDRIFGGGEDQPQLPVAAPPRPPIAPVEDEDDDEPEEEDETPETSEEEIALGQAWQTNRSLSNVAANMKLKPRTLSNRATLHEITAANETLEAQIEDATRRAAARES